jgi:glucose/arabinose dehydrogenase
MRKSTLAISFLACASVAGCGDTARLAVSDGMGPSPNLPPPVTSALPTVHIAPAKGWAPGATPVAANGLAVNALARGLQHPRWLYVLPNGDVLVAESNAPPKPDDAKGIKGWVMKKIQAAAGAGVPSANRITLLRDTDGDGVADVREVFLDGLNSPFGMALVGNDFYVATSDALMRYPYTPGNPRIAAAGSKVVDLPAGSINHHWTKNVIASEDGSRLYVSVGSNSNAAENGIDKEDGRAAIWEVDPRTGAKRVFASGLRNPNGMAWEPTTHSLWAAVNERDELGSDLVPDYMTSVRDGASTAGPIATTVSTSTLACSRNGPTSSPGPSSQTTRSVRTPLRSASHRLRGQRCRRCFRKACSSDSTGHGIAIRAVATRCCSCLSSMASPAARPSTCLPGS